MAWRIEGIGNTYRHAARSAAQRAGVSLGEWLDRVILNHKNGPTREEADAEIARALEVLESRIEQSSQKLDDMIRPLHAEVDRLATESERMRDREKIKLADAERLIERHLQRIDVISTREGKNAPARDDKNAPSREGKNAPSRDDKNAPSRDDKNAPSRDDARPAENRGQVRTLPPLALAIDPEENNHDPWTRHRPHGAPRLADANVLRRRRIIRVAGGLGAIALIVGAVAAAFWVFDEHEDTRSPPRTASQPGLVTPSADQTPPRILAVIEPDAAPGTTGNGGSAAKGTTAAASPGNGAVDRAASGTGPQLADEKLPETPTALAAMRTRAEARDVQAEYLLGRALLEGKGGSANPREGAEWISTAAVAGHARAQLLLGRIYQGGVAATNLPADPAQAFFWIQSAAEQGITEAEYDLGMIYSQGAGVERSHALAARWFRQAGEKNHAPSLYQLGLIYELGLDYRANKARAIEWYRKAAEAGSPAAREKLAQLGPSPDDARPEDARKAAATAKGPGDTPSRAATAAPRSAPAKAAPAAQAPAPDKTNDIARSEIAEIQRLLKELDFDPGLADGRPGAKTEEAIRQFQSIAGGPADGKPSRDLLRQLREITGLRR